MNKKLYQQILYRFLRENDKIKYYYLLKKHFEDTNQVKLNADPTSNNLYKYLNILAFINLFQDFTDNDFLIASWDKHIQKYFNINNININVLIHFIMDSNLNNEIKNKIKLHIIRNINNNKMLFSIFEKIPYAIHLKISERIQLSLITNKWLSYSFNILFKK